jgi:hypothetical protein
MGARVLGASLARGSVRNAPSSFEPPSSVVALLHRPHNDPPMTDPPNPVEISSILFSACVADPFKFQAPMALQAKRGIEPWRQLSSAVGPEAPEAVADVAWLAETRVQLATVIHNLLSANRELSKSGLLAGSRPPTTLARLPLWSKPPRDRHELPRYQSPLLSIIKGR